jgi:hypothetical protein
LGLTLRTRIGLPSHLTIVSGLPLVPSLGYVLHGGGDDPTPATQQLAALIKTSLQEQAFRFTITK